jgi:hypothetical protein
MAIFLALFTLLILGRAQSAAMEPTMEKITLDGTWRYELDPNDSGVAGQWFGRSFTNSLQLPGSLSEQEIGNDVTVNTQWTGDITTSWYQEAKYAPYRQPGNIKISFFLQPDKYYVGAAWYQREILIPPSWSGLDIMLSLERVHWGSSVWVDGTPFGSIDSLGTAHVFKLGGLAPGTHLLSIRIDNRLIVDVGGNASSVTDHTQGNWNGIIGEMSLSPVSPIRFQDVQIYPHTSTKSITVKGTILNSHQVPEVGTMLATVARDADASGATISVTNQVTLNSASNSFNFDISLGDDAPVWDEFTPALFDFTLALTSGTNAADSRNISFGLREITTAGTQFAINGHKTFLRGTLECCIFPKSGHPPTDVASWRRIISIAKSFGLNLMRFHSWCPPEAAFRAADELGFYFQVECETWSHPGGGGSLDTWLYTEAQRILTAYGNHPSFLLMTSGNEPSGANYTAFLTQWVTHFKNEDSRHLFTSSSGWPQTEANQFHVSWEPRIQWWGAGLTSPINAQPPQTTLDFRWYTAQWNVPVISHEIGEWCAYPNFDEIPKFTNFLKAKNFEVFRDFLDQHHMKELARPFLMASGKLQVLCYKEEIESALRTPGMGGFELLDLHDFPGQGTALVGVLDAFWDEKGYVSAAEYSRFCNSTVPLARLSKRVFTTTESLNADLEIAHFGAVPLTNAVPVWYLIGDNGIQVAGGTLEGRDIPIGNGIGIGNLHINLSRVPAPARYKLGVGISGTRFTNDWDIWVYPSQSATEPPGDVLITPYLNPSILDQLTNGAKVLLTVAPSPGETRADRVKLGFSSIFWNTDWTHNQQPTTLGILCDPTNALFKYFPTDYHSNWQWWYLLKGAEALVLDDLPAELSPAVRNIDDWFTARRLGMLYEAKFGDGKIIVCSINVDESNPDIVARQFRRSLLKYMASDDFKPQVELSSENLAKFSVTAGSVPPTIVQNPVDATRVSEHRLTLQAIVDGTLPLSYSWIQNGQKIVSGTSFTSNISMTIGRASSLDSGTYSLQVTNAYGSVESQSAKIEIIEAPQNSYLSAVADLDPLAYWEVPEGTNSTNQTVDLTGNHPLIHSNTGIQAGPLPPDFQGFSVSNKSITFDGSTSGSQAQNLSLSKLSGLTILGWFNPASMPQPPRTGLFGQNDFAEFGFHGIAGSSAGALGFWIAGPIGRDVGFGTLVLCTNTESLVEAGKWSFVAATADGTNTALYLNGSLISSASAMIQDHYASSFPFQVGFGTLDATDDRFKGSIDGVAVFDRALSPSEINLLYSKAVRGDGPGLTIQSANGKIAVNWNFGALQTATNISGPFADVPRASSPLTNAISDRERFFRVRVR